MKVLHRISSFYGGMDALTNSTKCKLPCSVTEYFVQEAVSIRRKFASEQVTSFLDRINDTLSPILTLYHTAKPIKVKTEVLAYSLASLLGDAGGIIGIAIGASVHTVYEGLISPLLSNVQKIM